MKERYKILVSICFWFILLEVIICNLLHFYQQWYAIRSQRERIRYHWLCALVALLCDELTAY